MAAPWRTACPVWIETERLILCMPPPDQAPQAVAYFVSNREHLAPWDPPLPAGFHTEDYWRTKLQQHQDEHAQDRSMRLCLYRRTEPVTAMVGTCNFSNFVRGAFQACHLGYGIDHCHQGRGFMFEALQTAIAHAFSVLGLHRVMANYVPGNERSGRLLARLGFTREGYARDYLFINGAWRDHVLTALTKPAAPAPVAVEAGTGAR